MLSGFIIVFVEVIILFDDVFVILFEVGYIFGVFAYDVLKKGGGRGNLF